MSLPMPQAYTKDGFPYRILVLGQTTTIEAFVELDSSTGITITAATFELARDGSTSKEYTSGLGTVTISGNGASVAVSNADLATTLSMQELDTVTGAWTFTVSGYPNPVYLEEVFFVLRKNIQCPLSERALTDEYPLLKNPNAYPKDPDTGLRQTSWAPQIRIAWENVMQWFGTMGRDRAPWMICNCMSLKPLVKCEALIVISALNINGVDSQIYATHYETQTKERINLRASAMAEYQVGTRTSLGKAPARAKNPMQEPRGMMTGVTRADDFGKP